MHVFDRDGKTFTANITNVATERDFNRVDIEGHPPDAFEQGIAKFEGELAPALVRILESRSIDNEEDRVLLMNLIGLLSIRNPRQRENVRSFHERTGEIILDLATATKERWESQLRQMKAAGYAPEHEVPYEQFREAVKSKGYRLEVTNERHIALEMSTFDAVLETLVNRQWWVLLASKETGGFITCDHPVCLMFSDPERRGRFHGPGHGLRGTQIIFPVGRHMALIGAFELKSQTTHINARHVADINGAIVAYAERQVYSTDASFSYVLQQGATARTGVALMKDARFLRPKKK